MRQKIASLLILSTGALLLLNLTFSYLPFISFVESQSEDSIFQVNSSPYGTSFKEWTQKWWQWFISIPKQNNPNMEDADGVDYKAVECSYLQDPKSPVFFVPYVMREKGQPAAEATCNIPEGRAIMVGIDNGWMDNGDPKTKGAEAKALAAYVQETNTYPREFNITLDGKPIPFTNEEKYRVLSDPFNITYPQDSLWDPVPGGTFLAVADGWYLMLKPLPPGEHILHYITGYKDHSTDPSIPIGQGNPEPYFQDVTYHLHVNDTIPSNE